MKTWRQRAVLLLLGLAVGACSQDADPVSPASASDIRLGAVSFEGWAEKLAAYPPDIVVVDMWATWCVSCLERFPHMVALWQAYRDKGVRFVSLNLDDHEDQAALAEAREFLGKFGAGFENYYMDENLMVAFARLDLIGIPAVVIYDRQGREAARLTGDHPDRQFSEADVEAAVLALLQGD